MSSTKMHESLPPESFVVKVYSELDQTTVQRRWRQVNTIMRLSMLAGTQIPFDASLNMLLDFAAEIVSFERALLYLWSNEDESDKLRLAVGFDESFPENCQRGNVFSFWAARYERPLLVASGANLQADAVLEAIETKSALIVPLIVSNRVVGSVQLFSSDPDAFSREDAQLLWILVLVAESQLTRDYENEGLIRFAFTDFLTGLKTRGYFEQQLDLELKRAERKRVPVALLMLDIDHFKVINDTYGHHVGDHVLRDVSSVIMNDMREGDTAARYGGEEFVVVLPETSQPAAMQVAQRIRQRVERAKFFTGSPQDTKHLTISIGVSMFDQDARFKHDLIEAADAALYAAKSNGRNQVVAYNTIVRTKAREIS